MKKRILTFGVVLVFAAVLVVPGTVLASNTTEVVGDVESGYTFTAPSAINLGTMTPSATPYTGNSTDGSLLGNNADGYTVTGTDAGLTGYMVNSGPLTNRLEISNEDDNYVAADSVKTFLATGSPTDAAVSLYVRQLVSYNDTPGYYSITIEFTVAPK